LESGKYTLTAQDETSATYCKKIEKDDGRIDWNMNAETIYRMWQAYTPWPTIFTSFRGKRLILENIGFSNET
jgi:methionyl-tRNA formyltransferase